MEVLRLGGRSRLASIESVEAAAGVACAWELHFSIGCWNLGGAPSFDEDEGHWAGWGCFGWRRSRVGGDRRWTLCAAVELFFRGSCFKTASSNASVEHSNQINGLNLKCKTLQGYDNGGIAFIGLVQSESAPSNPESILKKEMAKLEETMVNSRGELLTPLVPREEKSELEVLCFNLRWKKLLVLFVVWISFLLLQVLKNGTVVCSTWYWVLFLVQFPIAFGIFGYKSVKLYRENKRRLEAGNSECVCGASIQWTAMHLAFCAVSGIAGGTVGGLLGSGGGFILGPLLLEIGVIPQVASATATFVMMYSSSLSVVEFYLLKRFPIPYALYLISVSVLAGFWGQSSIRKLVAVLKRVSIIVFILSGVIFASALTMGVVGVENSIQMMHDTDFLVLSRKLQY